ncbi:MAG: response regulator transcription factor [Sphingomonas bacterium]|nr:response regulator transcription factor [Sphingomonas bacterium]
MKKLRTAVIVDDHPMCRQATGMALRLVDSDICLVEADTLGRARDAASGAVMMTLDLGLPDSRGLRGLATMREEFPDLPMLVITGATHPAIEREVAAIGANGYLSKAASIGEMTAAIRCVIDRGYWFSDDMGEPDEDDAFSRLASLTPAQMRVLEAMEGGRLNKQIAHDLGLSVITIKAHVKAILRKLDVTNRTQAILMLREAES